jgi:hypothetical protein
MTQRHREEVLNTLLAFVLTHHGIDAEPETSQKSGKHRPDVMFRMGGLRVVIEGKYADVSNAEDIVANDAKRRLDKGICQIAVAVVYPKQLRDTPFKELLTSLASTPLHFCVLSLTGHTDWRDSDTSAILAALRRTHQSLIADDIVESSAKKLSGSISDIADLWSGQGGVCDKLSKCLGMPVIPNEPPNDKEERRIAAAKIASLVLANALIFQEQLCASSDNSSVLNLKSFENLPDPITPLRNHWNWISTTINYVPIFKLGEEILTLLPAHTSAITAIHALIKQAQEICGNQSALRHDLMGRIYHWMIHHAKYLGTYYTSTSAATLLLVLTFAQNWVGKDFGSTETLKGFTVADLTCGTGTLLMAAAQAITDQFIVQRVKNHLPIEDVDLNALHVALMENVLHGYDVLPSAVHLTASTLGMLAPSVCYQKMNLFIMPMGVQPDGTKRLGSLDFIEVNKVLTQLTLDESHMEAVQTSTKSTRSSSASVPDIDLCVMNPPFVRSVGGNLLFGSLPDHEREQLQKVLKNRAKTLPASIVAGLGSVFIVIADKYLREGGRMAFVLPVALATGESWGQSRKLLADKYHVEIVMVSHDANHLNFSENTSLSEIMFIARKLKEEEKPGKTTYINLWRNPQSIYDGLGTADLVLQCLRNMSNTHFATVHGAGGKKLAEVAQLPPTQNEEQWIGVQFAQTQTLQAAISLAQGVLNVPGQAPIGIHLCTLGAIGALGPDRKVIHNWFKVSETNWSAYPSFWNHDSRVVKTITQKPNSWLHPKPSPNQQQGVQRLWQRSGRILLVERVRTTTHHVLAIGLNEDVLGNTWWALKANLTNHQEKTLLLWLNSTPALLLMLARRVTTEGAWMQVKQPQWEAMPVLDVCNLNADTLSKLAAAYDTLCDKELLALAKLDKDSVRAGIDDALSVALGLPDMSKLRELLAHEPGLTGKPPPEPPMKQQGLFSDSENDVQLQLI